jgi:hypothetical protein
MTFSFYAVIYFDNDSINYKLDIDGVVYPFGETSILNLVNELEVYCVNWPGVMPWGKKVSAIEYFQPQIDNNEVTIVNICDVTYKSMEEFIVNIIPDLHKMRPELLI